MNIPTAVEFAAKEIVSQEPFHLTPDRLCKLLIEFTKLHVKQALEAAANNADIIGVGPHIDKDSILNAYPESNIK